jgi:hypothetical protein
MNTFDICAEYNKIRENWATNFNRKKLKLNPCKKIGTWTRPTVLKSCPFH